MEIIMKTPQGEMTFEYLCIKEYKRINLIMKLIEDNFGVSLITDYPELRHEILNVSNFIKRLPLMVSEIIEIKDGGK